MTPTDIDPEAGCRLPLPNRDELDAEGQALFDRFTAPRDGQMLRGLRGPVGIKLHSPRFAVLSIAMVRYLRFESGLPTRAREVAILSTARCFDSQFEWTEHEGEARKHGVPAMTIEAIKHDLPTGLLDETDALVIELGRQMFRAHKVRSETYAQALAIFGRKHLVDLAALMGNYAATAAMLALVDMQLDPGVEPLLPGA
jgi:4-carboxymuconolactone decarboxylase